MATSAKEITPGSNPILDIAIATSKAAAETAANRAKEQIQIDAISNATSDEIQGVRAQGQAQQLGQASLDAVKLQTSAQDAASVAMLGVDPLAANNRLQQLTDRKAAAGDQVQLLAKEIADKQSKSLLSDPLGFINAQFELPALITQHNYYATAHNEASSEFDDIVSKSTAVAVNNKANEATMTLAAAQAKQQEIGAVTAQNIAKVQAQGAQFQLQGIRDLQSLNMQDLQTAQTKQNMLAEQSRIAAQNANADLNRQQKKLVIEQLQQTIAAKKATQEQTDMAVASVNKAQASLGGPVLPPAIIMSRLSKNDPVVMRLLNIGEDIAINGGNKEGVAIGRTPGEVGAFLLHSQINPIGTSASTMTYIGKKTQEFASDPMVTMQKDPEGKLSIINKMFAEDLKKQDVIHDGDTGNIRAAPSITALVSSIPALANNGFIAKELIEKAKSNHDMPTSANDVYAAGLEAIKKDPKRLDEVVAGMSSFFNASIWYNNKMKGFTENALPIQTGYTAAIKGGYFGRTTNVDMTNPLVLKTKLVTEALGTNIGPQGGPINFGIQGAMNAAQLATQSFLGN